MARPSKKTKTIYERIEEKKKDIKQAEEYLIQLNEELKELFREQDELEMLRMLEIIRSQGIDIETALAKLSSQSK